MPHTIQMTLIQKPSSNKLTKSLRTSSTNQVSFRNTTNSNIRNVGLNMLNLAALKKSGGCSSCGGG